VHSSNAAKQTLSQSTLLTLVRTQQEEEETGAGIEGWLTVWVVVSPGNEANLGRGFSLRGRWKRYWCFISNSDHCLYYVKDPSTVPPPHRTDRPAAESFIEYLFIYLFFI
jgi:hypothetical protein